MVIIRFIFLSLVFLLCQSVCLAQTGAQDTKPLHPTNLYELNHGVTNSPQTFSYKQSFVLGKNSASIVKADKSFFQKGFVYGLALPVIGPVITFYNTEGAYPLVFPASVDSTGFRAGYLSGTRYENRSAVVKGGFIGSSITCIVIGGILFINALKGLDSMGPFWPQNLRF